MVNIEIILVTFFAAKDGKALYSKQKQDRDLTVAQTMNILLPNSDINWINSGKPLDHSVSSVQFSRSVFSDSLWLHESQHTRPPCPSPSPGVHSNSRPSSWWCHPAISSSVVPFSSCPQSLPVSEFQWVNSSHDIVETILQGSLVLCVFLVEMLTVPRPRLPLQGYLYCKQPWKIEIISTSEAKICNFPIQY